MKYKTNYIKRFKLSPPVSFHPELPIILTGSEDCTVRVWHANTYRLENTLNYGLDRVWCISALKGSNNVCFGYDEGSVMVKVRYASILRDCSS